MSSALYVYEDPDGEAQPRKVVKNINRNKDIDYAEKENIDPATGRCTTKHQKSKRSAETKTSRFLPLRVQPYNTVATARKTTAPKALNYR